MNKISVNGFCDPAFEKVKQAFLNNFKAKKEIGAAVSVLIEGEKVVDIWAGYSDYKKQKPWQSDTLANIFSATKGVTAICALRLVEQGKLDLDEPVATYWPEFGVNGKEKITVRMLLNHRAGMVAVKKRLPLKSLYNWDFMASSYAAHAPWWEPGKKHGYHAVSYGWLIGQLIYNITGMSVGEYLRKEISQPLDLDLHIGLDENDLKRSAQMIASRTPSIHRDGLRLLWAIISNPGGGTASAFTNPWSIVTGVNSRSWRKAELPSANGQSNAGSLARLYGILANGGSEGDIYILSKDTIAMCSEEESHGRDAILKIPTRFSLGFMLSQDFPLGSFGPNRKNFGHPGAGGALGFADIDAKLGFGYVANKMDTYILVDPRAKSIIDAMYSCL